MLSYKVTAPTTKAVPILISVPHCGVDFPKDLKEQYDPELLQAPDDTDWFVDRLYDFAPGMGIAMITAVYSRWVIDLNRDPLSKPLYGDGRIITALCPTTTFLGEPVYRDGRSEVGKAEAGRRLDQYYWPYHRQLASMLADLKSRFGKVLLWDCHSIRQVVPTIQKEKFPDLILGSADGTSASPGLIETALEALASARYELKHNHPFKGGHITRAYGDAYGQQHALQLEMTKVNYMDDAERTFDVRRADEIRRVLVRTFEKLIAKLTQ